MSDLYSDGLVKLERLRYSELDWLRVFLILAVFLHHIFTPFSGDGWLVMNNESSKLLDDIMVYFEQWRLQILFFVAGAGSYILLQRTSTREFLTSKFHRLLVPLVIAMMLIVPPQSYYKNINEYSNLYDAYRSLIFSFESYHLWFIEFLIIFMVLAVPVNRVLRSKLGKGLIKNLEQLTSFNHGLFSLVLVIILSRLSLKFLMPSQSHVIENLSVSIFYLLFFLAGMCFVKSPKIWQSLAENRAINLKWLIVCSVLFYSYYYRPDISEYVSVEMRWQLWWLVCTLVSWSGLLVLVGYAITYCNKTPKWLATANELIYPFYILHQTVLVSFAFYIVQWDLGIAVKSISLLIASFSVTATLCYFLIKPLNVTRYMFGLKIRKLNYGT